MISISIIIPVYGVEKYIERCLRSLFRQDFSGYLECILVDDCSPDASIAVAKELIEDYSGNICFKILRHEFNKGLSATRNTGFAEATGDYVFFLDSDDELMPDAVNHLAALAMKYPGVDIVCGDWYVARRHRILQTDPSLPEYIDSKVDVTSALLHEGKLSMTAPNKLLRRAFLRDNSINFRVGIYHEDELFNFYLAEAATSLAVCSMPTYVYFLNPAGITALEYNERRFSDLLSIVEEILANGRSVFRLPASLRLICIIAHNLPEGSDLWPRTDCLTRKIARLAFSDGFYRVYFYLLRYCFSNYRGRIRLLNYRRTTRIQNSIYKSICNHQ